MAVPLSNKQVAETEDEVAVIADGSSIVMKIVSIVQPEESST